MRDRLRPEDPKALRRPSPLRSRRDYGEDSSDVLGIAKRLSLIAEELANPYLNVSPTELERSIKEERDPGKRRKMQDALNAWRLTVPGPFRVRGV